MVVSLTFQTFSIMTAKKATGETPKKTKRRTRAAPDSPLEKMEAKVSRLVGGLAKALQELKEARKPK